VSLIRLYIKLWYGTRFCLLHGKKVQADEAIFLDTSEIIKSNRKAHASKSKTNISASF
jgi:hypothetical protein